MKLQMWMVIAAALVSAGCKSSKAPPSKGEPAAKAAERQTYPTLGSIERREPELDDLIGADGKIEKLAEGFDWSEGPVWMKQGGYLLFSDVPSNVVYRWKEGEGITRFLQPSGYTGSTPRGGEPGSNGLTTDANGL